ncbi:MAG: hypothetical protein ACWA5U_03800 [bacterium]
MIKSAILFCIFITLLAACSNEYTIQYYAILDGNHGSVIFRFDNIRKFQEITIPKNPTKPQAVYKVLTKKNKVLYAEYFNYEGVISSTYHFNSLGRITAHQYLTKNHTFISCQHFFNEKKQVEVRRCYNEEGQQIEHFKTIYKNNLKFKTTSFNAHNDIVRYFLFNYNNKKIVEFDKKDTLVRTIDISQHQ